LGGKDSFLDSVLSTELRLKEQSGVNEGRSPSYLEGRDRVGYR
jgi:hypothetical protein